MQNAKKEKVRNLLSVLLLVVLLSTLIFQMILSPSGNDCFFSGEAEVYYQSLLETGFPEDYAKPLTELHLLHPTWKFEPLLITEQNAQYTWSYVLDRETEEEDTNLISKSDTYAAYWHELNRNQPETGYYQPSRAAVAYFMDPRNFLNEADIFQFFDLSGGYDTELETVEAVLRGTFMENTRLENGMTYAAYFREIGRELGINPVFLAVKVRQEQGGTGSSPVISGTCGSKLNEFYVNQTKYTDSGKAVLPPSSGFTSAELLALNGLYNYYNIKASGEGVFDIYHNAMSYAQSGTPALASEWGGSAAWNTRWKALKGGAYFLKTNYVDAYQSTIYLQKFNVDSRSGSNFWKQYMASIPGAMSEGRILYQSFASTDILDSQCSFLIPVYEGMPKKISADPANGACTATAVATKRFTYTGELTSPDRKSASNAAIYLNYETYPTASIKLEAVFTHSYGLKALEYRWDSDPWRAVSDGNMLDATLPANFEENSSHILVIRGKTDYGSESTRKHSAYVLCAVIYVKIAPPPSVTVTYEVANTVTRETHLAGNLLTLPTSESEDFAGWLGSDGSFLPSGGSLKLHDDLSFRAIFLDWKPITGAALSISSQPHLRFSTVMRGASYEALRDGDHLRVSASWKTELAVADPITLTATDTRADGSVRFDLNTPVLPPDSFDVAYTADFTLQLFYTDGTTQTKTQASPIARSAKEVATAALADPNGAYTSDEIALLETIAHTTLPERNPA